MLLSVASLVYIARGPARWLLLVSTAMTLATAMFFERIRRSAQRSQFGLPLVTAGIMVNAIVFAIARLELDGRAFMFSGVPVATCLAVALLIDVYRGEAPGVTDPMAPLLYLVQFPVLPAGPIVRYRDFSRSHLRLEEGVSLGAFTYGMRRLVIGLVKLMLVAAPLGGAVDEIFALPPARLGAAAAWLAAISFALQIYFQFSGYADLAIGIGRMLGFRYPENFRRPYVADSVREFWRRWHITAITWLRDYLSLPIAGRDRPTPPLFVNTVIGFCLVGLWHGAGSNVAGWAIYSAAWLALEAIGLGRRLERWPAVARHLYVLVVAVAGWVFLRADSTGHALTFLGVMVTGGGRTAAPLSAFLTPALLMILCVAIAGAGPMVPGISRWRVALDALTASLVMMATSVPLFVWRVRTLVGKVLEPFRRRKFSTTEDTEDRRNKT